MATQRSKLINDAPEWSEKQRYKVNAVVVYNDVVYQNITGSNSIPSLLTDWIKISINDLIDFIPINGTDIGNPVIGDIEFDNLNGNKRIKGNSSGSYIEFIDDGAININYESGSNVRINNLNIKERLSGESDYSNIDPENKLIYAQRSYVDNQTGWEQITDTTYTVGSPLTISEGVTGKILTGTVTRITTQLPDGVTEFWNNTTKKLMAVNDGDSFILTLRFKSKMDVSNGLTDFGINIGGSFNVIEQKTELFSKGSGVEQRCSVKLNYFTGTTFISNGGDIEVTPLNGNIDIYDIVLIPNRIHKGK